MQPFIKWAGGKRQLLDVIMRHLPVDFTNYVEPFVGGGALFFTMEADNHNPKRINDTNHQLINCYVQIRDNPQFLIHELEVLRNHHNQLVLNNEDVDPFYYHIRREFNLRIHSQDLNVADAAKFIYLNKTGFNGLYRVNSAGFFNVPSGKKGQVSLFTEDNILQCSDALQRTDIRVGDFEESCKYLRAGAFVFFDSPYYATFDSYQSNGFSKDDHIRLAKLFRKLHARGINCMVTNSNTEFIRELYVGFTIQKLDVKRLISSDVNTRQGTEVLITSYNEYRG